MLDSKRFVNAVYFFGTLTLTLGGSLWAQAWAQDGSAPAMPAGSAAPTATGATQQPSSFFGMVLPFVAMFAVLYFLMIRPQQKKMKEQQAMLTALKSGDEVLTASGILGKVTGITDKVVTVEVADNVRVKMLKTQVAQVIKGNVKDIA